MSLKILALLLPLVLSTAWAQLPDVRVLLERVDGPVVVEVPGAHRGYLGNQLAFETPLGITWPIDASGESLLIDGMLLGSHFTLSPRSGEVDWRGSRYRGDLRFVADDGDLLVVNVLDLESYLRGVVPGEMMASWPHEALKAQAVASRTYTLGSLAPDDPYDICATVACQVYAGLDAEDPRSDRAITETFGLVLTYAGELARTYYHSDSGGVVASSDEVWGVPRPYLTARTDVSAVTPHRGWSLRLDPGLLQHLLAGLGVDVGEVSALRITAYSDSGRATEALLTGRTGSVVLSGTELTALLRDAGLKSTRVRMIGDLLVQGDGWGHGVGMSQYGARQLALAGHRFDEILGFYYPQTILQPTVEQTALERSP